ncbi:MAG TPA: LTA synthase family protein [Brumimicrobium sp.]|nr:LTA synthase family protein [Brumimicrobium sp.]
MAKYSGFQSYIPVVLTSYWMILIIRGIELLMLSIVFGWNTSWFGFEALGILYDFALMSSVLLIFFPLFHLIHKLNKNVAKGAVLFLFFLFTAAHFLILSYFIHQLIPLDIFLYHHPFEEIYFTVTTSNVWLLPVLILIGILSLIPCFIFWGILKKTSHSTTPKAGFYIMLLGTFTMAFLMLLPQSSLNKFTQNKSGYFYFNSIKYAFTPKHDFEKLNTENIAFFQAQYPHKKFTSKEYPLLYERSKNDALFESMERFDTVPNVVLLIVEGLSDEYIHNYHGIDLMPFLNQLKDSSLYWESCFTLGERSFAAVPSLLGGLPYGDLGFTLLNSYPHHHTLVNLLKAKQYHTAFYYGQGAWFHNKRNFFKYNNVDWILDKEDFAPSFKKIIVGDDNYFWGYNDRDLYEQYFKSLDSLPSQPYFNTFFTGSSHPPYVTNNDKYYSEVLNGFKTKKNRQFISTYATYLKTLIFVDDAIEEFFESYKKRADYENTIFIITGDHPMSELPRINELTKYHVPLLIYSPKLKSGKSYRQTVSHLDLSTSLLSMLEHYTGDFTTQSASLGFSLFDTDSTITRKYAFMDGNRGMYEYYSDGYYLRKDDLYKVGEKLTLELIKDDQKKGQLKKELENFKTINYRTSFNNLIMNHEVYTKGLEAKLIYSRVDSNLVKSSEEYNIIVPSMKIPNRAFRAEIYFDLKSEIKEGSSIVFQIKDEADSILSWQNGGLNNEDKYHLFFNYKQFPNTTGPLEFQALIWNQGDGELVYKNLNVILHEIEIE